MPPSTRQSAILQRVRQFGRLSIAELAGELGVSPETVRRDLRGLVAAGALEKLHGAVCAPGAAQEAPFERRMRERVEEKRRIARAAAALVADGDSLMIDTGTTTSVFARELLARRGLTVVTNSSDIARTLATVNANRVYMAGGALDGDNGAALGRAACAFAAEFRVRFAVISIAAVGARAGLMDYRLDEAEFARAVLAAGERRLVLTDATKFARTALVRVAGFDAIDLILTDRAPPDDTARAVAAGGAEVRVVP